MRSTCRPTLKGANMSVNKEISNSVIIVLVKFYIIIFIIILKIINLLSVMYSQFIIVPILK